MLMSLMFIHTVSIVFASTNVFVSIEKPRVNKSDHHLSTFDVFALFKYKNVNCCEKREMIMTLVFVWVK